MSFLTLPRSRTAGKPTLASSELAEIAATDEAEIVKSLDVRNTKCHPTRRITLSFPYCQILFAIAMINMRKPCRWSRLEECLVYVTALHLFLPRNDLSSTFQFHSPAPPKYATTLFIVYKTYITGSQCIKCIEIISILKKEGTWLKWYIKRIKRLIFLPNSKSVRLEWTLRPSTSTGAQFLFSI